MGGKQEQLYKWKDGILKTRKKIAGRTCRGLTWPVGQSEDSNLTLDISELTLGTSRTHSPLRGLLMDGVCITHRF
jgi:hypothetical protein